MGPQKMSVAALLETDVQPSHIPEDREWLSPTYGNGHGNSPEQVGGSENDNGLTPEQVEAHEDYGG